MVVVTSASLAHVSKFLSIEPTDVICETATLVATDFGSWDVLWVPMRLSVTLSKFIETDVAMLRQDRNQLVGPDSRVDRKMFRGCATGVILESILLEIQDTK